MGIEYRLLGRLEVLRDGVQVDLGSQRQRALLALLLANAGTVLSTDRILDELWGDAGAADKQNSLWVYVSGLRGALEPDRPKRSEGNVLLTRSPGYVAAVDPANIDSGRFERCVERRAAHRGDRAASAAAMLRDGLALWRGHAFEEFVYEGWAQADISRLEELRLEATEMRVDADMRSGLSGEVVSELKGLVRQHPLRERFVASLMLALYRCGRTAEALRAFAAFRERLVAEIGVDPSRSIRDLEQQILSDDEALLIDRETVATAGPRTGLTVRGYELRERDRPRSVRHCVSGVPTSGGSRGRDQGDSARARRRSEVHPALRGRSPDRRRARTPPHRPPLRLLARAASRISRDAADRRHQPGRRARRWRAASRSGRLGVRSARERVAVCTPQRRHPPRRQAGEHPDRPRRQRLPHRLRHGVRLRRRRSSHRRNLGDRRIARRPVRCRRSNSGASDVACLGRLQPGGRCREGAHRADRRLRGSSRGAPRPGAHGARPRHGQRPATPILERCGLRAGPHRSARRRSDAAARRCCDRESVQGFACVRGS